ncbi:hypothetical protein B0J14DRAFT_696465 [Halenospora varia]|nr:hypothetical protein B0J14DRAFT_696465 [Halenospora varia]
MRGTYDESNMTADDRAKARFKRDKKEVARLCAFGGPISDQADRLSRYIDLSTVYVPFNPLNQTGVVTEGELRNAIIDTFIARNDHWSRGCPNKQKKRKPKKKRGKRDRNVEIARVLALQKEVAIQEHISNAVRMVNETSQETGDGEIDPFDDSDFPDGSYNSDDDDDTSFIYGDDILEDQDDILHDAIDQFVWDDITEVCPHKLKKQQQSDNEEEIFICGICNPETIFS